MYCKYCGQPLPEDDAAVCPACGANLTDGAAAPEAGVPETPDLPDEVLSGGSNGTGFVIPDSPAAEGDAAEEGPSYYAYADPYADPYAAPEEPEPAKKKSKAPAVIAVVVALALVVGIMAAAYVTTRSSSGDMDQVVLTCEEQDFFLTNAELNYYFWSEYYYLVSYYGDYLYTYTGIDTSTPLSEQAYSDTQTWEDYFVSAALSSAKETMSFVFAANEAGFTMPDEYQENLDATLDSFETYAIEYGFTDDDGNADVEAYLQDSYGEGATYETFVEYLTDSYLCAAYSNALYNDQSFTDEEVSDYYDLYASEYEEAGVDKTTCLVDVRHILLSCDMDDEDAAAETLAEAEALLAQWQEEDGTEEGFAALAEEYSDDSGSNTNGGLYEDIYPGEMTTNFNDWCFDESRQVGDTGIVETSYGYHIMYFSAFGEEYWYQSALADLMYENYNNAYLEITERYTFNVTSTDILVATPTGLYGE